MIKIRGLINDDRKIIKKIAIRLRKEFEKESTGHDWFHIERVWKMAKRIAKKERKQINILVLELAALLHDELDFKFVSGHQRKKENMLINELRCFYIPEKEIKQILFIVKNVSFKGAGVRDNMKFFEGKIVQDADRLDALGAIGIARAFAYGGHIDQPIYNPDVPPIKHVDFADYRSNRTTTINHFYEKLLLIPARLHTQTAKKLAEKRLNFINIFLVQFYKEWRKQN